MEKKLLREKKLVRNIMIISELPFELFCLICCFTAIPYRLLSNCICFNHFKFKALFSVLGNNLLQEQKRREMILARELKKPVEDMVLKDSKVRIPF